MRPRHRTIAATLERADPPQPLGGARVSLVGRPRRSRRRRAYNELAGDGAGAVHAHEDAIAFYERALECETDAAERGAIVKKIADRRLAMGCTKRSASNVRRGGRHLSLRRGARARSVVSRRRRDHRLRHRPARSDGAARSDARAPRRERVPRAQSRSLGDCVAGRDVLVSHSTRREHLACVDPRALAEAPDIALRFHNVAAFVAMTQGDLDGISSRARGLGRSGASLAARCRTSQARIPTARCAVRSSAYTRKRRRIWIVRCVSRSKRTTCTARRWFTPSPRCAASCAATSFGLDPNSVAFRRQARTA